MVTHDANRAAVLAAVFGGARRSVEAQAGAQMSEGPVYGALPARAFGDQRFTAGHFRMLGLVAAHDRMSLKRSSAGCFAAQSRLADLAGLHLKSAARLIGDLVEWGYLERSTNPINKRLAVYRVVFDDADAVAFRGDGRSHTKSTRPRPVTYDVTDAGAQSVTPHVTDAGRSVTCGSEEPEWKQRVPSVNIFPEGDSNRFGEAAGSAEVENPGAAIEVDRAERAAKAFEAQEIDQADALQAIRRAAARLRHSGRFGAAERVEAIGRAVAEEDLRRRPLDRDARPSAALIAWRDRHMRGAA